MKWVWNKADDFWDFVNVKSMKRSGRFAWEASLLFWNFHFLTKKNGSSLMVF